MLDLPMLGTKEQTEASKYQITLVNTSVRTIHPMEYERINRFFEGIEERNMFIQMFETSILKNGGKLVHQKNMSHPFFESFAVYDDKGMNTYEITVYK